MAKTELTQRIFSHSAHQAGQDFPLFTWAEAFIVDRKAQNLAKGTIRFYREKLQLFLAYCESQVITEIPQITPNVIRRFLLYLEEAGHNPGGVHTAYRTLRAFLNWWEEEVEPEGWKNPIRKVKAPKVPEEPIEPVDLETVRAMVDTCKEGAFTDVRDKALLLFLLDTGMRVSECLDLNLEDIDLIAGEILIRQGKGRKPRLGFLEQKARRALRSYLKRRNDKYPAVWITDEATRLTYDGLRGILTRRAKTAGVDAPSAHDFRRAFALNMLRNGVDLITLSRLMGHTSLAVLKRYLKQVDIDLREGHRKGSPVDNAKF